MEDIQNMLDSDILATIPEHLEVQKAISRRTPVVLNSPNSPPSREIRRLAGRVLGIEYKESRPWYRFFSRRP